MFEEMLSYAFPEPFDPRVKIIFGNFGFQKVQTSQGNGCGQWVCSKSVPVIEGSMLGEGP
jgi:hypothetical protein